MVHSFANQLNLSDVARDFVGDRPKKILTLDEEIQYSVAIHPFCQFW